MRALDDDPGSGAAYGYICLQRNGRPVDDKPYKWSGRKLTALFPSLLVDRWWNTDAPLFRRSVSDAVGSWTDLRWSQDWEYDGRVGALRTRLVHTPEFVCDQRQHGGERQTTPADWSEPDRARSRKRFLGLMLGHAQRAGVTPDQPEMQHFSRWLFRPRVCVGRPDWRMTPESVSSGPRRRLAPIARGSAISCCTRPWRGASAGPGSVGLHFGWTPWPGVLQDPRPFLLRGSSDTP